MGRYPKQIEEILREACGKDPSFALSSVGISAAFECGVSIRFAIRIGPTEKLLENVNFITNGCGFMTAAAQTIAKYAQGRELTDLHGTSDLEASVASEIGPIPVHRAHCIQAAAEAFRNALKEYRSRIVEEFQGEKALICTCFGVVEETILEVIERTNARNVSEVAAVCRAGSGCGSCRMLVQELIDSRRTNTAEVVL